MSRTQRGAVLVGALVVAIAAFLVLRPGDDEESPTQTTTTTQSPVDETTGDATTTDTTTNERPAEPEPEVTRIRIRGGEPVGGPADIQVSKNETIRLAVTSDVEDEVHIHGYDLSKPVGPGQRARFAFKATIDGGFQIELEERAVPIAELEVTP